MANNVSAAKPKTGGAVSVAPSGTTLPKDATTALPAAFKQLGYISDSGLTNSNNVNVETKKAWGGDEVLTIYQGREDEFKFTLIEGLSLEVLKEVYGEENVTGTIEEGISITVKAGLELPEQVIAIDMILKDGTLKRIVIPCGRVTNVGDITYSDSDAIGYETTVSAMADSEGATHYEYLKAKSNG